MKKMLMALLVVCLCGSVWANGIAARGLSDGEMIQVEGGYQLDSLKLVPNYNTEYGVWGRWHEDDPHAVNGAGVYALMTVDPNLTIPINKLFPYVGTWLQLPESISGTVRIGFGGGIVNMTEPDAVIYPLAEVQFGPLVVRAQYDIVDAGGVPGLTQSDPRFTLGIAWPIR